MSPTPAIQITLSAREVVAAGAEFRPWDRALSDPDVALDEISALRAHTEPLVLRVEVYGGTQREHVRLGGDWLCEADGTAPRVITDPLWEYDEGARAWSKGRTWLDAWEQCEDARWMLHAVASGVVDRRLVVLAGCDCARMALSCVPTWDAQPRLAIETAETWARGGEAMEFKLMHVTSSARASSVAAEAAHDPLHARAARSAETAALAARYPAVHDALYAPDRAAEYAASAMSGYDYVERRQRLHAMADVVRRRILNNDVLRAASDR